MEHYSTIKKKILPFATTWMELEGIMLSEISQTEKDKYCMISYMESKTSKKLIKKKDQIYSYQRWGAVRGGGIGRR